MNRKIKLTENLNRLLQERGVSMSVAAKRVGMNKNTLQNYCKGVIPRHLLAILRLADFLGVNLNELIYGQDGQDHPPITLQASSSLEGRYELTIERVNHLIPGRARK